MNTNLQSLKEIPSALETSINSSKNGLDNMNLESSSKNDYGTWSDGEFSGVLKKDYMED